MLNRKNTYAPLLVPLPLVRKLLRFYDYPDPRRPQRVIRGYDRQHALRTARMCASVALKLGHDTERVRRYQVACILHDLGRAGLDRKLFGLIWSWAKMRGIPTRPREWRVVHPQTKYGRETEAFVERYGRELEAAGIALDDWALEQVEMRLGYARRLGRRLREVKPKLAEMGIRWLPWMELVMLYYYYPEKLAGAEPWIRELGEILVACEQFEAYNNRQRGQDYYTREKEALPDAFSYLAELQQEGILSEPVVSSLWSLVAEGAFDELLEEARGRSLTRTERQLLRTMSAGSA
ncbi:MAG TPA: HD domain-containing protein [Bdellovibrionota bacterium]|nr:HD domain-containing protein [Bdellovibrionota bacterium]